ncbi:hypothetical protein FB451DRAFT_94533 [Mycena latifolia]|nr:hypothetical protein FB451DRAFT_94533 [Mycena latifolia]
MDGVPACIIGCNYKEWYGWLTQANHIFNRLGIASNHEDYALLDYIECQLIIFNTGDNIPSGYLFLCPLADLQPDNPSYFRHPECAAYWSLDPSGVEHLGMEEAEQLGFPSFEFTMEVLGFSWDESVYTGVRQFHQAKGFDPDSLDVAREVGCQLYQLLADVHSLFAHDRLRKQGRIDYRISFGIRRGILYAQFYLTAFFFVMYRPRSTTR